MMTKKCLFLQLFLFTVNLCPGAVVYPFPDGIQPASDFEIYIDGQPSFVYNTTAGAFTAFESDDSVYVTIKTSVDVKYVDIRPLRLRIIPEIKEKEIQFVLPAGEKVSIELNKSLIRPLFIFANRIERDKPSPNSKDIIWYKAGRTYDVGDHLLKDNAVVYIEGGAVVKGSFKAEKKKNVTIMGRGIIDGTNVRGEEDYREAVKNYRHWKKLLHFIDCKDILVKDVILMNSNAWNLVPDRSEDVTIDNVKIVCNNPSDDAIDIVQSKNVTVCNSFIRSKDDCIAIKSLFDDMPDRIVSNVHIYNCVLWSPEWGNAFEIGYETLVPYIEDIVMENCDIIHVQAGAAFSVHNSDYAVVRNLLFKDIRIEDARDKLIDLVIFVSLFSKDNPYTFDDFYKNYYQEGPWANVLRLSPKQQKDFAKSRGKIQNIRFENISVTGIFPYSVMNGFDADHNIENIQIRNLYVNDKHIQALEDACLYRQHTENVVIE
ncbi:MAG: glycosyl hydrolase family 28 protein [Bacteroidales bacterium]|nr:glycosyl hydrolase family 28 protein [Bacteroidales bacterium]